MKTLVNFKMNFVAVSLLLLISSSISQVANASSIFNLFASDKPRIARHHGDTLPYGFAHYWTRHFGHGHHNVNPAIRPVANDYFVISADSRGKLIAVERKTGKVVWRADTKTKISSGPSINDNLLIVGTSDGRVIAFNINSGKEVWEHQAKSEILAAPTITDNAVYVKDFNGCVMRLNRVSGDQGWTYCHTKTQFKLRASSAIAVGDDLVIAGFSDGHLIAFDSNNGDKRWEKVIAYPTGESESQTLVDIATDPVVIDGIIYVATYQGNLTAVNLDTGQILWQHKLSTYRNFAANDLELYVIDSDSLIHSYDLDTGAEEWKQTKLEKRQLTSPIIFNDFLIFGDSAGYLIALSRKDGKLVAQAKIDGSGIFEAPYAYNDKIYVTTQAGNLSAYSIVKDKT